MERARARVVKVRESRERERRDMCSSMATGGRWQAGAEGRRECRWSGQTAREKDRERTQSVAAESQMELRGEDRCFGGWWGWWVR